MKGNDYLTWQEFFIAIVQICSLRSKDPNIQVGIISPANEEIVAIDYNCLPRRLSDDKYPWTREGEWKDTKFPHVIHAKANKDLNCYHLYTNLFPCNECAKLIIQPGIDLLLIKPLQILITE